MDTAPLTPEFIKDHIHSYYEPIDDYAKADLKLSTADLFEKLRSAFPVEGFTSTMLFGWMMELGFSYIDAGELKIEWLMKKINVL